MATKAEFACKRVDVAPRACAKGRLWQIVASRLRRDTLLRATSYVALIVGRTQGPI